MLLVDLVKELLYHCQSKNYSKRTIKGYRNNLEKLVKYLKVQREIDSLQDVKPAHIQANFSYLLSKGRNKTYVNEILKNIRSFLIRLC